MKATLCDGCGGEIKGEAHDCGLVLKCEYCAGCRDVYAEFEAARDGLHDRVARIWQDGLAKLKDAYAAKLARIPDRLNE